MTKYIPQAPEPPQAAFLLLDCQEALYGGAAGGGKSSALLMAALQYVDVPGYNALILRRSYKDLALPEAIMYRARAWLAGSDAHWDGVNYRFTFPSGATLSFGYLEHDGDELRYQGAEFQFIGIDELTQFPHEYQYLYLFSRLRRLSTSQVPLRVRAATNPGGPGHEWVRRRFIDKPEGLESDRLFVPASVNDNPHLDRESYINSLMILDPVQRARLLNGDWVATETGQKFRKEWFDGKLTDTRPEDVIQWIRFWDLAATEAAKGKDPDYTVGALVGRRKDGSVVIGDIVRFRATPGKVEEKVREVAERDGKAVAVRMEQEPGASGVAVADRYRRQVLFGFDFKAIRSTGSKEVRANPFAAMAEAGDVWIVRGPWNASFFDELEAFPLPGFHDDQVDAASGALSALAVRSNRPVRLVRSPWSTRR
ncbi:Archaeophage PsiM2, terminase large subunit [uncultured Caudovirales phage]|uniref:Archaeophage PsiM2, terminase large subunit n=1 Tax=uncultured Caudovirales phage TaxID=2100421 RepID=A0A6J5PN63_9CAUD|nr:Archaeophage PsiM2, terminase large subunit [uncultured Caudovirales phage]CAB4203292.1 Archaeophage PsiM2, terminase large subunit [uncultured Caudovirales phage]CAB4216131.1 Archaeophage PsiM2, terminase large subunit [uncultured Caudovirales phage]